MKPSPNKMNEVEISDQQINNICSRILDSKPVRRKLPLGGRLNIDRPLPFICVYRKPTKRDDVGTEKLVKGEASYLISSSSSKIKNSLTNLVQNIAEVITNEYKAFLIIEIWTKRKKSQLNSSSIGLNHPEIRLKIPSKKIPTETVETLEKALKLIRIQKQKLNVELEYDNKARPEKMAPLISTPFSKEVNCFHIGIEIEPFFQSETTGELFPLVLRKLHQGLSRAIKLAVFQFSHYQTTSRPTTYLALGKRALVKTVWEVDQKLAEISNSFDFLLLVTPINIDQSWNKFKLNKFEKAPTFYYRPININPSLLKRSLYNIPIEQIEDPTLSNLFYEKQAEVEKVLTMLRDRRTRSFFYGSMQLYGELNHELIQTANKILEKTASHKHKKNGAKFCNSSEFYKRAEEELNYYRQIFPELPSKAILRKDITGLMVSKGNLLIGSNISIPEYRVNALLQHEIGTHIVTYVNGKAQPFKQLYTGLAGYDELQEGLAVLSEYLVGGLTDARLRLLAGRVVAAASLVDGATFVDTFRILNKKFDFTQKIAYIITARIYRGGGLTKDAVYLRGLIKILKYFSSGGELEPLLVGKISSEHVLIIKELQARKVLAPLTIRPRYFEDENSHKRLNELKKGVSVLDLIKRR